MKKLALLLGLLLVFSLINVFATEEEMPELLVAPVDSAEETTPSEETSENVEIEPNDLELISTLSGEEVEVEEETEMEPIEEEPVEEELVEETITPTTAPISTQVPEETSVPSSNNNSVIGAIIAVVIVIAVVAIAAILRKD